MPVLTETTLEAANGKIFDIDGDDIGLNAADDYEVLLYSEDTYSEALSRLADVAWGDTDNEVFSGKLAQKIIHIGAALGFVIGNRIGARCALMGGEPGFLGLAIGMNN